MTDAKKKAAGVGAPVTRATAFSILYTSFQRHSSDITSTLTGLAPGHGDTASCTLHSDDLKALS